MNEIVSFITANPVVVLTDEAKYSEFYKTMKAEVTAHEPNTSTEKGRKDIAALAYKVTRTKTAIDAAGKKLNEDARAQINTVDASRRKIRDELDALAEEARKPLTDWETAEKQRVEYIQSMIRHIENCGNGFIDSEPQAFAVLFRELEEKVVIDASFGEFKEQAEAAKRISLDRLKASFDAHTKAEADREELERLRADAAEREAKEAARQAEEEAKAAAEREARAKADAERLAAERAAKDEADRVAAIAAAAQKAKADAEEEASRKLAAAEAEKRALIEAQARADRERAAEAKRLADEQAARDADKAHRGSVMKASKEAIMSQGADEETAKKIVLAIVAGEIPNVTLRF